MIRCFTPYSTTGNFFEAIDTEMKQLNNGEWGCLLDGDTMFLYPDFGHKLQAYVDKYPDTGLFTCLTNRCSYACQRLDDATFEERDILAHFNIAQRLFEENQYSVVEVNRRIAGHLMLIKKETWAAIRAEVERMVILQHKKILGVDTKISNAILQKGLKIRVMQGFYVFHLFRLNKNNKDTTHLK